MQAGLPSQRAPRPATAHPLLSAHSCAPPQYACASYQHSGLQRSARILAVQADLFKPNHYLSLHALRELTLKRLQAFVAAKFSDGNGGPPAGFDVRDYLNGECYATLC